ncbi:LamG domain-containing protein [Streptomyces sp. NBC_00249]|uniref:LamG domain-containing protein n=1 Tax=Streptomyces sp. NBC_00249 TaxID=2975690 RepID=UPI00224FCBCA|nr:LamG domain-containing protein [Streptomyces sp. NBC_00249]MCX5195833.1 LamG domain-containing protein [Streptomyces sp. NBC_00249]
MTDGTDRPHSPQPDPASGSGGGYGFPPGQISGGYGYPPPGQPGPGPAPNPYQPSEPAEGQGFGPPPGAPEPGLAASPEPFPPAPETFSAGAQPDWQAMADRTEAQRRKRRMLTFGIGGLALVLVAAGTWFFVVDGSGDRDKPQASASGSPSPSGGQEGSPDPKPSEDDSPTVAGEPNVLRDRSGRTGIALGPGASLGEVTQRTEVRFKGAPDSYAQAAEAAVDVTKSFSVSTRAYNVSESGSRMAVSQGDGDSYSFELGFEVVGGKKAWVFRVQTGDKGQAATAQQVVADNVDTTRKWALLTGTYDAQKKTIALWVDDKQAGTAQVAGIWNGPGPLQLGRARHHGIWSAPWDGPLDHIRIFDQALEQPQVTGLKNNKLDKKTKPTHSWLI